MVPGMSIVFRASKLSKTMRRWRSTFPGSPNMLPRLNLTRSARGGLIFAMGSGSFPMEIVQKPDSSAARWIRPTV